MKFNIRKVSSTQYVRVLVSLSGNEIDIGLLDPEERRALAGALLDAHDELLHGLDAEPEAALSEESKGTT